MNTISSFRDVTSIFPEYSHDRRQKNTPTQADFDSAVTISEEALAKARCHNETTMSEKMKNMGTLIQTEWIPPEPNLASGDGLTVTSTKGTVVTVNRTTEKMPAKTQHSKDVKEIERYTANVTAKNGQNITFELTGDVRITDLEDGSLAVTYANTGETHVYDPDGAKQVLKGETGVLSGTDGDDIFINMNGASVDGGEGDDTIINFADDANLQGGNGDDTIILGRQVSGNTINTGEGDDKLIGVGASNTKVEMGEGNNVVDLKKFEKASEMTLGNGNNRVSVAEVGTNDDTDPGTVIHIGNGNNTFDVSRIGMDSDVALGGGDNTINARVISGTLRTGDGDNTLSIDRMDLTIGDVNSGNLKRADYEKRGNGALVYIGNGKNTINIKDMTDGSLLQTGDGNNNINMNSITKGSTLRSKDGDNKVTFQNAYLNARIELGDGDNQVYWNSMDSEIRTGNGNNTLIGESMFCGSITTGSGNDHIVVGRSHNISISTGNGDDYVGLGLCNGGRIDMGDGNDTAVVLTGSAGALHGKGTLIEQGNGLGIPYSNQSPLVKVLRESLDLNSYSPFSGKHMNFQNIL